VAVGGGSVIDLAKGVGIVSANGRSILEFEGVDRVSIPMPPLVCIPTTGGSSADVSQFAIITDIAALRKIAIVSKAVVPDVSLVDPETLTTMDPYLAACTAMDAMTHAVEAFVSNASSPLTDLHALEAVRLLSRHLVPALQNKGDMLHRTPVMLASLHAGLAFSNAILGAAHAMAHSLGGYLDLPHGECNAILLDRVIEFNYPAAPERFDRIAEAMGIDLEGLSARQRGSALVERIRKMKQEAGLGRELGPLGVRSGDIPHLSRNAVRDPCLVTNPRPARQRDLEVLYGEAL
jgi:alcohol dehydrogenase class IV